MSAAVGSRIPAPQLQLTGAAAKSSWCTGDLERLLFKKMAASPSWSQANLQQVRVEASDGKMINEFALKVVVTTPAGDELTVRGYYKGPSHSITLPNLSLSPQPPAAVDGGKWAAFTDTQRSPGAAPRVTLPQDSDERLSLYAPDVAKRVKGAERRRVFHGGNASPREYNPILVSMQNGYSAACEADLKLALAYTSGGMDGDDSFFETGRGSRLDALRKLGHEYFGIIAELEVPAQAHDTSLLLDNDIVINDFLFTTRIGTYNLAKLARAKTPEETRAAVEWFSTPDFVNEFLPDRWTDLIELRRSATQHQHDYDRLALANQKAKRNRANQLAEAEGLFFASYGGFDGRDSYELAFRYRDRAGQQQTVPVDATTRIAMNGETHQFGKDLLNYRSDRLTLNLPGGGRLRLGKRPKVPDKLEGSGESVTLDFGFDRHGNLRISVLGEKNP